MKGSKSCSRILVFDEKSKGLQSLIPPAKILRFNLLNSWESLKHTADSYAYSKIKKNKFTLKMLGKFKKNHEKSWKDLKNAPE